MKLLHISKKLVALLFATMLLIAVPVQALTQQEGTVDASDLIIRALQNIEPLKEEMGYSDIDFTALSVGNPIHAYQLTEEGMSFSRLVYPLFENGELVVLGLEVTSNNTQHIQLTLALVDEIKATVDHDEPMALVYTENGCYVYTKSDIKQIAQSEGFSNMAVQRQSLSNVEEIDSSNAILTCISPKYNLAYTPDVIPLADWYYYCGVSFVPQPNSQKESSNICWAATIACIANYIKGTNYSAMAIAKWWYPDYTYPEPAGSDYTLSTYNAMRILNDDLSLDYVLTNNLRDPIIADCLSYGYPIYSQWNGPVSNHAVTIYAINLNSRTVTVMCPINRSIVAEWNGSSYSYVSPSSNNEFTLYNAAHLVL